MNTTDWTAEEIQDAMKKLVERGATDARFRTIALSDPNEAVRQVAGKAVPEGIKVRVVENAGAHYTIVLPDLRSSDVSELSDAELEHVAGGRGVCAVSCGVTTTISATVSVAVACI